MKIAIEYILWLEGELRKVNQFNLDQIEFFQSGMRVEVSKEQLERWAYVGLNNVDFVTTGAIWEK